MASPPLRKKRKVASEEEGERQVVECQSITAKEVLKVEEELCIALRKLNLPVTVTHVYNPLQYASQTHSIYCNRYAQGTKKVLFLGMNPGPFGMAQNGVPFGDCVMVKDWLGISGPVDKPADEHPKRPVLGLACPKKEISGSRFWGFFQDLCGSSQQFARQCFVYNYCPFCFMAATGKNVTPPMLKGEVKVQLQEACDRALWGVMQVLSVEWVVGVGKYGADRAKVVLKHQQTADKKTMRKNGVDTFTLSSSVGVVRQVHVCSIMHPSPINPAANRNWTGLVRSQLEEFGLLDLISGSETS